MLGGIKRFIKSRLLTDFHPFLMSLYHKRQLRIMSSALSEYDAHSRMSYAEIESAIGSQYQKFFGRTLNWDSPQTYNEKIHVSKVYMPDPIKTRLADKYLVREWITERIGSEYLIPLLYWESMTRSMRLTLTRCRTRSSSSAVMIREALRS